MFSTKIRHLQLLQFWKIEFVICESIKWFSAFLTSKLFWEVTPEKTCLLDLQKILPLPLFWAIFFSHLNDKEQQEHNMYSLNIFLPLFNNKRVK